jgi:1,4-dihydroxy-2-naphthoyl-CoA hydrolase
MSQELSAEAKAIVENRGLGELAETMGIKILELTGESGYATMPVEGNRQPLGLVHGGAYVVLGETLGSMCATLAAGESRHAVGIEINASHSGSAKDGLLHARASLDSLGRTLATHSIEITDDNGKRLSTIRITNYLRDNR